MTPPLDPSLPSPLVSFLIPAYNVAPHIREALESVLRDPRRDIEVVVVNDGSTDETGDILASISDDRVRVISQSNLGLPASRNTGLRNSSGKYVVFLDGDDGFNMSVLDSLLRPLEADSNVVLTYGGYRRFTHTMPDGRSSGRLFDNRPSGSVLETIIQRNFIGALGACCFRRAGLEQAGPFNTNLRMGEDWEMYVRLAGTGDFKYVRGLVALHYRQHAMSMSAVLGGNLSSYVPFSDAVFATSVVNDRFDSRKLVRLRRSQQAHIHAYIASRAIEGRAWRKSLRELINAVTTYPPRALEFITRVSLSALRARAPGQRVERRT